MNLGRTGRYYYLRIIRLKGDPHSLAFGAAIGVFIGITPTMPLHTIMILAMTLLTRSSFIAGLIMSWVVSNPLTYLPQYYLSLKIGNLVTPYELNWAQIKTLLDILLSDISFSIKLNSLATLGYEAIVVMLVGGSLLALPFTVACYYYFLWIFVKIKKTRLEKHILR